MAHKIFELLVNLMGVVGIIAFMSMFVFVVLDVVDVYLKLRERLSNDDFPEKEDKE